MLLNSDKDRLRHMIEAAKEAVAYASGRTRHNVDTDPPLKHLLIRNLEILGEAASRVSPELQAAHGEISWHKIIGTRNRLIHAYST